MLALTSTLAIFKELLIILFLFSIIPIFKKIKYFQKSGIIEKLSILFICGISIRVLFFLFDFILPITDADSIENLLSESTSLFIITGVFSLLIGALCIISVLVMYELLMFNRKRFTTFNFKILIFLAIMNIAWLKLGGVQQGASIPDTVTTFFRGVNQDGFGAFLLILVYITILINALKSSWVAFTNRRQKYVIFAGGVLVLISLITSISHPLRQATSLTSSTLDSLLEFSLLFFLLYVNFSLINILLHLPSAGLFDKKIKQLSSLHQLSSSVASVLKIDKLVVEIVNRAHEITNSDSAWLLIRSAESNEFTIAASKNLSEEDTQLTNLESDAYLNGTIIRSKASMIVNELDKELTFTGDLKGSLIGIPLNSTKLGIIGILYAKKTSSYGFREDEDYILKAFANHAVVAIENARYFNESILKKELEKEIAVARTIQEKLLPKSIPEYPGIEIARISLPCKEVGGDYYDLIKIDKDMLGVAIADVSGKGIPASLLMSNLQACLRTLSRENLKVKEVVSRTNAIIFENTDDAQYITFFFCIIDVKKRKLTYCNAGHNPPILAREADSDILLQGGGTVLGWQPDSEYRETELDLMPGDRIFFYTDGVTEAMNIEEEEFEEWRLKKTIGDNKDKSVNQLADQILKDIYKHTDGTAQTDDITLVALYIK